MDETPERFGRGWVTEKEIKSETYVCLVKESCSWLKSII